MCKRPEAFHKLLQRKPNEKAKFRNKEKPPPRILIISLHIPRQKKKKKNFRQSSSSFTCKFSNSFVPVLCPSCGNQLCIEYLFYSYIWVKISWTAGFKAKRTFSIICLREKKIQRKATIPLPKKNMSKHLKDSIKAQLLLWKYNYHSIPAPNHSGFPKNNPLLWIQLFKTDEVIFHLLQLVLIIFLHVKDDTLENCPIYKFLPCI